jgi:MoxR-like ATPase
MQVDPEQLNERVAEKAALVEQLRAEVRKAVVGQDEMISRLLVGLLCEGHILLEGVPGLAKTTAIKSLAQALETRFQRIQFTPDLLPADLVGTLIYVPSEGTFRTAKGPIFANFILADEINRAPPKVQSALMEAMQERQVTIGEATYPLERPFLVMATQNPIEHEGTYPLPEAQVDRFMLKVKITYPKPEEERQILERAVRAVDAQPVRPSLRPAEVAAMQELVRMVYVDDQLMDYIIKIVTATRSPARFGIKGLVPLIEYGASPRASIYLGRGIQAVAFLNGRGFATPQDVKDLACDVLRHRLILTYEAEAERTTPEEVIQAILNGIPVP